MAYKVGDKYQHDFSFTQDDVKSFASLSGDTNPLHLDQKYASKTVFKRPIMHGVLPISVISMVLGTKFPGEGTIYSGQSLHFKRPAYVDTTYIVLLEIMQVDKKGRADIQTFVIDKQTGKIIIEGTAKVINRSQLSI